MSRSHGALTANSVDSHLIPRAERKVENPGFRYRRRRGRARLKIHRKSLGRHDFTEYLDSPELAAKFDCISPIVSLWESVW